MQTRDLTSSYLRTLAANLRGLDPTSAADVVREIESHIHDAMQIAAMRGEPIDEAALLQGFGSAESLAAQYVAHIKHGAPPPAGFRVLQRVKASVSRALYYSMGALGFSIAIGLLLLAIGKVLNPTAVGLWSMNAGQTMTIGWSGAPSSDARELIGIALIPIAVFASVWCAEVTRRVLRVLKRGLAT